MLRLRANKSSLYKLVGAYETLPLMRRTAFAKAYKSPEYRLKWINTSRLQCEAFLAAAGGRPKLIVTKAERGGAEISRVVYTLDTKDLLERGMVEEFIPATERRRAERMADHEMV